MSGRDFNIGDLFDKKIAKEKPSEKLGQTQGKPRENLGFGEGAKGASTSFTQQNGKVIKKATYELDAELLERFYTVALAQKQKKVDAIETALRIYIEKYGV